MRLPWERRWWELVPEVALGAVPAVFLATETAAATSAFGSRKALTLMAGAALAWAVGRIMLVRFTPWPALRLAVSGAAAVAAAAVVVLPARDDTIGGRDAGGLAGGDHRHHRRAGARR